MTIMVIDIATNIVSKEIAAAAIVIIMTMMINLIALMIDSILELNRPVWNSAPMNSAYDTVLAGIDLIAVASLVVSAAALATFLILIGADRRQQLSRQSSLTSQRL